MAHAMGYRTFAAPRLSIDTSSTGVRITRERGARFSSDATLAISIRRFPAGDFEKVHRHQVRGRKKRYDDGLHFALIQPGVANRSDRIVVVRRQRQRIHLPA